MTARAPSRAKSFARTLAVVDRAVLERVQSIAQSALDFVAKAEDDRLAAHLAAHLADDAMGTGKPFIEAAATRAGLEELLDLVDRELALKSLPGEHHRDVQCLREPISLRGANPIALGIAAKSVEKSPINLAHARLFPPESRQ